MRIVTFCSNYPPHTGGLEVLAQALASGLGRTHEVTVIAASWGEATGIAEEDGVVVHRLPAIHRTERWGVPYPMAFGPGVRPALAAARSADVCHAHGALYASTFMAQLCMPRRTPLFLTEHVGFVPYGHALVNGLEHVAWATLGDRAVARADTVVAYNQRVGAWLRARYPRKAVEFIRNGVDANVFRPRNGSEVQRVRAGLGLPEQGPLVLFVGRDASKKNIDAVLNLPRDDCTVVVCGAHRALDGERLIDLGILTHDRMPDLYACCDLMVLPSVNEGFPVAAQEAMASGLPLVLRWDHGYSGMVSEESVASYQSPAELPRLVRGLLGDSERRVSLSRAARSWALENWSWTATISAYEQLFLHAIEQGSPHVHGAARA